MERGGWDQGRRWTERARCGWAVAVVLVLLIAAGVTRAGGTSPRSATLGGTLHADKPACTNQQWNTTHLQVFTTGCTALFWVFYEQQVGFYNVSNPAAQYNITFSVPWVAEVTPTGQLVRIANPMDPAWESASATIWRGDINVTTDLVVNVTKASGSWTPDAADNSTGAQLVEAVPAGGMGASARAENGTGSPWNVSNEPVGNASLSIVFHLTNGTNPANTSSNTTQAVKFDVGVNGWPWATSTDRLGFALVSSSAFGSHFGFDPSTATLAQRWDANNASFVSLVFGGSANVTYPSAPPASAAADPRAGAYPWGEIQRAFVLVTFENASGGFSSIRYDPWVVFSPNGQVNVPLAPSYLDVGLTVTAAVVAIVVGMAGILILVVRNERRHREGTALLRDIRAAIETAAREPGRPR